MTDETFRRLLHRGVARASQEVSRRLPLEAQKRVHDWNERNGERLRLDYELDRNSFVMDLGGYRGQWASDMYGRFGCRIFVFEPIPEFVDHLSWRFEHNRDVEIFNFGLGSTSETISFRLDEDATRAHVRPSTSAETGEIQAASAFLDEHNRPQIDVMKVNIEGGEYDLLPHLIDSGHILDIRNLQVQFHDFVPRAEQRMGEISGGSRVRIGLLGNRFLFSKTGNAFHTDKSM